VFWRGRGICKASRAVGGFSLLAEKQEADGSRCLLKGTFLQTSGFVHQSQAKAPVTATLPADVKHHSMHSTAHYAGQTPAASSPARLVL